MCARFPAAYYLDQLCEMLGARADPELLAGWRPRYNVAPSDEHPVLRMREGERWLVPAKWGLVPHWATDPTGATKRINARAETVATTPAFRDAFERHRCVVPTSGFFEWTGPKKARKPIWYHAPDRGPVLLAGVFDHWKDARTDTWLRSFSIVTTPANDLVAAVHDRMPAVLARGELTAWLTGSPAEAKALLRPALAGVLVPLAVSPRVSSPRVDAPTCLEPVESDVGPLEPARRAGQRAS